MIECLFERCQARGSFPEVLLKMRIGQIVYVSVKDMTMHEQHRQPVHRRG
jgi:hypothetical protein